MKKFLAIAFLLAILAVIVAEEVAQPQMLTGVEDIERQRKMYPEDAQKRISQQAVTDGFKFLSKGNKQKAMYEFNRAWRFYPKRYEAWEGAAQVQTSLALETTMIESEKTIKYLQNSVELREKALPLAAANKQMMAQTQLAMSYNQLAMQYLKNDKPELAKEPLEKAEKIIVPITIEYPNNGFAHFVYATNAYWRKDFETCKKEIKEAQRCNFKVPVEMLEDLK